MHDIYQKLLNRETELCASGIDCGASALQEPEQAEWSVSFTCDFEAADACAPVCEEAAVGKEFAWDDEHWLIPAVYLCSEGLVIDFCVRILPDRIQHFMRRWNLSCDSEYADFDLETQMQIDADNPLCVEFHAQICLDGRTVKSSGSCGLIWNPCLPEQDRPDVSQVQRVMEHYHLDSSYGWSVQRVLFPWAEKQKPKIASFTISLERYPVNLAGPHFRVHASGDTFRFLHPVTGVEHLLTVREYEQQKMQDTDFGSDRYEFPKHCTVMSYTLSPDLSSSFFVQDCAESDRPRKKEAEEEKDQLRFGPVSVCAVGAIIGGAYSSSTPVRDDGIQPCMHAACSALHFVPEKDVTWRIVFSEKRKEDVMVSVELSSPSRSSSMGCLNCSGN